MFAATIKAQFLARFILSIFIAAAFLAGATFVCLAADSTMVDPAALPRLEGAQDDGSRASTGSFVYVAPGSVPTVVAATKKLLAADGWTQYVAPLEENATTLLFKKGPQGLLVYFTMAGGKADQSSVHYVANRINADVPFPDAPADVVYDSNRPYLSLVAPGSADAMLGFFDKGLTASGWSRLSAADAAARWPNATLDGKIENGALAYYGRDGRDRQRPVRLSLQSRADGKINVEIKVASFALPADLEAGPEVYGMPRPKETKSSSATNGRARRELKVHAIAELGPVVAFYRRELSLRNWKEDERSAVINANEASLMFASEEGKVSLRLTRQYDLTVVNFILQVSEAVLAAQERARKEESEKFMRDAQETARQVIAADETRRAAANAAAAGQPAETLRTLGGNPAPIPLPETAENVEFDGGDGKLEYNSSSSVKSIAAFHRAALKSLGWREQPSVINNPTMVAMDFAKGGKSFSMTVMQMGPKARVSADGEGLVSSAAAAGVANDAAASGASDKADQELEAEERSGFPVPKGYTLSAPGTFAMQGTNQTPFRREFVASVPANLASVLAFYRRELTKRDWKELPQGAIIKADQVQLAFSSPEGPAVFKLARAKGETGIDITVKNPAQAAKAGVLPPAGQVKVVFGNMTDKEAAITIADKTIKIAPGAGGPQKKDGPAMELRPGKYRYSVKAAGQPPRSEELEVLADDTWGLMVGPGGVLAMQIY